MGRLTRETSEQDTPLCSSYLFVTAKEVFKFFIAVQISTLGAVSNLTLL